MRRTREQIAKDRDKLVYELLGTGWATGREIDPDRDSRMVFGDLRWLERRGMVVSKRVVGKKRLFFCVDCQTIMTKTNPTCPGGKPHDLRPVYPKVRVWRLSAAGVRTRDSHEPIAA